LEVHIVYRGLRLCNLWGIVSFLRAGKRIFSVSTGVKYESSTYLGRHDENPQDTEIPLCFSNCVSEPRAPPGGYRSGLCMGATESWRCATHLVRVLELVSDMAHTARWCGRCSLVSAGGGGFIGGGAWFRILEASVAVLTPFSAAEGLLLGPACLWERSRAVCIRMQRLASEQERALEPASGTSNRCGARGVSKSNILTVRMGGRVHRRNFILLSP